MYRTQYEFGDLKNSTKMRKVTILKSDERVLRAQRQSNHN